MNIGALKSVLTPPDSALPELTSDLGLLIPGFVLPSDFVEFIQNYGSGSVDEWLWIFHPDSENTYLNLKDQVDRQMIVVKDAIEDGFLGLNPAALDDKLPMVPFAITDNGDLCCWTNPRSGISQITAFDPRGQIGDVFEMSFLDFIYGIVTRGIRPSAFPEDFPDSKPRFVVA